MLFISGTSEVQNLDVYGLMKKIFDIVGYLLFNTKDFNIRGRGEIEPQQIGQ